MIGNAQSAGPAPRPIVVVALLLVGANLRPAIVAVAPLLPEIRRSEHLSSSEAGLLTTIPLICFGLFAFLTPRLGRRFSQDRILTVVLAVLAGSIGLRLIPGHAPLLIGTTIAGASVAVGNVILPSMLKREFPNHIALMTGCYAMALSAGAALAAGFTVPLAAATHLGWRPTLALWAIPVVVALAVLAAKRGTAPGSPSEAVMTPIVGMWRDRVAWSVTAYWGLQSLEFYAAISWIPSILQSHGMSAGSSGWIVSYMSIISFPGCLLAPLLARRLRRPGVLVVIGAVAYALALIGLAADPVHLAYLWTGVLGAVQGSSLSLALGFIGQRAPDAQHVAQLSTTAQGGGYLLAALGPVGVGALHEISGGWTVPLIVLTLLAGVQLIAGLAAARERHVLDPVPALAAPSLR
jgi:CP family cyanate transporter-like MFS transporter